MDIPRRAIQVIPGASKKGYRQNWRRAKRSCRTYNSNRTTYQDARPMSNTSTRAPMRYALINGERISAKIILQSETYTGHLIYHGWRPLGHDLPYSDPRSMWYWLKLSCAYCGTKWQSGFGLESDHIVPRSRGGANEAWNRAPICGPCNRSKGAQLGCVTRDGRTGYYWDGTPGHSSTDPRPRPSGARDIKPNEELLPRKKLKGKATSKGPFAGILMRREAQPNLEFHIE